MILKKVAFLVMMKIIDQHTEQINRLCELNKVRALFAFGSVTNDSFNSDSDIDLLVDIDDNDPVSYADKYFNLKFKLKEILNRDIDLLERKAIRNKYLKNEIERTKIQIYAERNPKMA
jgi:hypothetical protein